MGGQSLEMVFLGGGRLNPNDGEPEVDMHMGYSR